MPMPQLQQVQLLADLLSNVAEEAMTEKAAASNEDHLLEAFVRWKSVESFLQSRAWWADLQFSVSSPSRSVGKPPLELLQYGSRLVHCKRSN